MANYPYTKGLHDLGNGAWAYLQPDGSWGWSNAGLIVDGEETLLVDTLFDFKATAEMLSEMRTAVPKAEEMSIGFKLDGANAVVGQSSVGHSDIWESADTKVPTTNSYIVRLPAEAQLLIGGLSGFKMSAGSTISIVKLSD